MASLYFVLGLFFVTWADDDKGNIYPQRSFLRTLYADDFYSSGYCVESGLDGDRPGADLSGGYRVYQSCYHGRIDNRFNGDGQQLFLGNTKSVSYVDLGTTADIALRYGIIGLDGGSIWESIHWSPDVNGTGIVLTKNASDPTSFQPLTIADASNLTTVGGNAYHTPITDHIYLVRVCSSTSCTFAQTELYYKFIALNNASPFVVRWNLFYTNFELDGDDDDDSEGLGADGTAKVALGFAVAAFAGLLLFLIYGFIQKRKAVTRAVESPNVNTMATAYQAI